MTNEMIKKEEEQQLTADNLRRFLCPNATEQEIGLALNICKAYELNPFKREVHIIKYGDSPANVIVGYEVYLKRARSFPSYENFKCWTEMRGEELVAICEIYDKNWKNPFVWEAYYDECVQTTKDRNGAVRPNKNWSVKKRFMLKKVAIAQAHRLAYPNDLGGMPYVAEEIQDIDTHDAPTQQIEQQASYPNADDMTEEQLLNWELPAVCKTFAGWKIKDVWTSGERGQKYLAYICEKTDNVVLENLITRAVGILSQVDEEAEQVVEAEKNTMNGALSLEQKVADELINAINATRSKAQLVNFGTDVTAKVSRFVMDENRNKVYDVFNTRLSSFDKVK
jgi:phage recombination protein Bet